MVRDRIVFGVSDIRLKERLLRESSELTLEKAASLCRAAEESAKQLKELRKQNVDPSEPEVHVVKKPTRKNVMKRKYLMSKHVMKKLRPYKHEMLRLVDRGKCGRRKIRILVQHGEGFLGLLLSPILESLAELV
ncbi:Hypothetical predicted protein [Paramuricea clavata]|uniref:Uncharacterized protein n=1 Tax=Paramuricea clavata TaxID=317549 RepID=A0A7D9JBT1_PARCT|nr:Hypothetical predicted protein [Paramuricea clavata]